MKTVACLLSCLFLVAPALELFAEQTANKDAAYWQTYVAAMKPFDTLKVQLHNGPTLRGRLISTTTDDMLILRNRAFRHGVEQRVRIDAVKDLSRTHPTRDQAIYGGLAIVGGWLALSVLMWAGAQ